MFFGEFEDPRILTAQNLKYGELLSVQNIQKYLCELSYFNLTRIEFDDYLGAPKRINVPQNCEAHIMTIQQNLLIGVHHFFNETTNSCIKFEKNKAHKTHLTLSFNHQLFGLDIRSVLYTSNNFSSSFSSPSDLVRFIQEDASIIFQEPFPITFKNSTGVNDQKSKVCARMKDVEYIYNQTIVERLQSQKDFQDTIV